MGNIRRCREGEGFRLSGPETLDVVVRSISQDKRTAIVAVSGPRYQLSLQISERLDKIAEGVALGVSSHQKGGRSIGLYCQYDGAQYRMGPL